MTLTRETVHETLARTVQLVVPTIDAASVKPELTLSELGCNSIDRAEIVTLTIEELGLVVPVHEFQQGHSVDTLVEVMLRYA